TRFISSSLVNEARSGYNYLRYGNESLKHDNVLTEFHIPGIASNPVANGFPSLSVRTMSGTTAVRPLSSLPTPFVLVEHSFQWMDTVSWHKGNHSLKLGGEVGRIRSDRFQGLPGNASLTFDGNYTSPFVGATLEARRTGMADALLGLASGYNTQFVFDAIRLRSTRLGIFAQDDWRTTRSFTLSYGLRYEI